MIHPYKLRPYHNPEGVDESKVPDGWRFRYADEMRQKDWNACFFSGGNLWARSINYGMTRHLTYIVPVTP